jgi:hypothetical protein
MGRGNAPLGRPHSLRVLGSEAVPNPFPTSTDLVPRDCRGHRDQASSEGKPPRTLKETMMEAEFNHLNHAT